MHAAQPLALSHLLTSFIADSGMKPKVDAARAVEAWALVAGPSICARTESVRLSGAVLTVRLSSAAWRHTLHHQRAAWCARLNEHLGEAVVHEIVFR